MHRRTRSPRLRPPALAGWLLALATAHAAAQSAPQNLQQAFEAAWQRQPEAAALALRREAAAAQRRGAQAWTPEPLAVELGTRTDRLTRNEGAREVEAGIAVPLWLPGERGRSAELADAEARAIDSRHAAAQLRLAGTLRELWWQWQRARLDAELSRLQRDAAAGIAADVARRVKAGDLARADQHQADAALAASEAALAHAEAGSATAALALRAATGLPVQAVPVAAEPEPPAAEAGATEAHATLRELEDRGRVATSAAALAATQNRANPELLLATTRERGAYGERYGQTLNLSLRFPFGAGARHEARVAAARADAAEAEAQARLEREHIAHERDAARLRLGAARVQLAAAERRAQLAAESRGFFDKSFRLGETDLPTRLRIEAEAAEAERAAARSRLELAAAISSLRQALGLLPQ